MKDLQIFIDEFEKGIRETVEDGAYKKGCLDAIKAIKEQMEK